MPTGLTEGEIAEIEAVFDVPLPTELATFLSAGVPVGRGWADWPSGPAAVHERARDWLDRAFTFDIENNVYWHAMFGERPPGNVEAAGIALQVVGCAPPLIPIYAHRFLATAPAEGTRAVLSVWQADDSIFYGTDLADCFAREFGITRPSWVAATEPPVPVWEDLFGLVGG